MGLQKPYGVPQQLDNSKDISLLDNLITLLFNFCNALGIIADSIGITFTKIVTISSSVYIDGNMGVGTKTVGSSVQIANNLAVGYTAPQAAPTNGLQVGGNSVFNGTVSGTAFNWTNSGLSGANSWSMTSGLCKYLKIGKTVMVQFDITHAATQAAAVVMTGLPAPAATLYFLCSAYGTVLEAASMAIDTSGNLYFGALFAFLYLKSRENFCLFSC